MEVTLANLQLEFDARLNSGLLYLNWNLTFQFTLPIYIHRLSIFYSGSVNLV